jgi:hypothetical protein
MTERKQITVQPSATPAQPVPEDHLAREYAAGVWIPLLQNFFGGLVGVGGLVTLGLWGVIHMDWEPAILVGLSIGAVAFCLATAIRAFRDEVRYLIAVWAQSRDRATVAALRAEIQALQQQLARFQESAGLSGRYAAQIAAEKLLRWYFSGNAITRAACLARGTTRPEWEMAVRLLREAGVINERTEVQISTYEAAWGAVVRRIGQTGHFVRTADGDFSKL